MTKTGSLIRLLYADLPLKEGEGTVVGISLKKIKNKKIPILRRKIGIIFQDFKLLHDRNVNQNLEFVLKATGWKNKKERHHRIEEVLSTVGMDTKGFKMPQKLSGGELYDSSDLVYRFFPLEIISSDILEGTSA